MIRQYELVELVSAYDPNVDEALLNRAYVFAMQAHRNQTRRSGDPYFSHPLEVAEILTTMKLDCDTIATALLHDVVEDTAATIEEIRELFGDKVGELVDGVTKLSTLEMQTKDQKQAENFRKFVLAMSNDIRVLMIKLADRLHNMRTLHYFDDRPDKQERISRETLDIYAPLAERIGMNELSDELQNISFQYIDPEAMKSITTRLDYLVRQSPTLEEDIRKEIEDHMNRNGIMCTVSSRAKRPYSIWRKMEKQNISFEQLADVLAFRVIVDDVEACYKALGYVHMEWPMVPGRFKDYISTPKRNFYRSIHTAVIGPFNRRAEIQIRTEFMHKEAEYGVAAHWAYKQDSDLMEGMNYRWVRELLEILDNASHPQEFLEHTKLDLYQDKVFCFSPKGELVSMPRGATPVDFAYAVHTEIGDHCVGAKVNGRMVPLRYELNNGDQVEIQVSKGQAPSSRWESFVITGKARASIRRHLRNKERKDYMALGRSLIEKACIRGKLDFSEVAMREANKVLNIDTIEEMYTLVGQGTLQEDEILSSAYPGYKRDARKQHLPDVHSEWEKQSESSIQIGGGSELGGSIHFAECCCPVKGDRIVGVRLPKLGVEIHRLNCKALNDYEENSDIWLETNWNEDDEDNAYYLGRLLLSVVNEIGALATIAADVAKRGANLSNVMITDRDPEFVTMVIDVEVKDAKHLTDVTRALRVSAVLSSVDRI
ncbi:bifunctional (p)ppGpp synthetase/guanosine-3',5'-bis(diphosphate) 3'-pyrophosphohydrolase [Temperatibacter marinus]|uniref:GTP pyrophosphokinase rsh n=1 Tax=Temperatibacter marinus TaxID=1456591 RepID=A0AA52EG90_9PROT|nr:bifunctional (p)ppGpp synthetase/guanosine-3',5'-bis(diphosphate) 3'-pyrophosphohydrolase [Temperatibacter marinus]WND01977.1 bifunctional (p)ppGpp synthetase/guanosine-3',5'-bis(diphosphate) 3'-pyrophosphohydrolase [Temperatibacter marinus]